MVPAATSMPCRRVENPLVDVVGIDAAAIDVRQVQRLAGNPNHRRAGRERVSAPLADLRLRRRDQASAGITQRCAPGPVARHGADELIGGDLRRRVGDRRDEDMRIVVRIEALLNGAVVWVGVDIAADVLRLGERIVGADIQAVRETLDEFHLERIVEAIALIDELRRQRAVVFGERPQALRHGRGSRESRRRGAEYPPPSPPRNRSATSAAFWCSGWSDRGRAP